MGVAVVARQGLVVELGADELELAVGHVVGKIFDMADFIY